MTTLEVLRKNIERNQMELNNYYEDENDTRPEDHAEIEQLRTNILNLSIMYVRLTTGITDRNTLVDLASELTFK